MQLQNQAVTWNRYSWTPAQEPAVPILSMAIESLGCRIFIRAEDKMIRYGVFRSGVLSRLPIALGLLSAMAIGPVRSEGADPAAGSGSTADHSKFEELQLDFATGPDVTKACLACHTEAAKQIQKTTHWTWAFKHPVSGQDLGKKNVINNFCIATATNWPRCTSCHIGYGWKDDSFDLTQESAVDCLVCHDTTGTYKKYPTGAGHPAYEDKPFPPKPGGKMFKKVDLKAVAQSVGKTSRQTCGACHFFGGGGNAVKHGDLDSSMFNPDKALDVHMDVKGLNFSCSTCHTTGSHQVAGSRYLTKAVDRRGVIVPGRGDVRATCESCHGLQPHESDSKLNDHTDRVACQSCHIPTFARGGFKTKTWWDWSTAGRKTDDGKPITTKDAEGFATYDTKKGDFKWKADVVPEYYWFDGNIRYTTLGEKIDDSGVVMINSFGGNAKDPDSRIWPFKVMRGKQPYDSQQKILALPHLFGKDDAAYWKNFDWDKALAAGLRARGVEYSGQHGFVETAYYWPITHMVAPKEATVGCQECHAREGRLENVGGFYLPGRDAPEWLTKIGWALVLLTLLGVVGHGLLRVLFWIRER